MSFIFSTRFYWINPEKVLWIKYHSKQIFFYVAKYERADLFCVNIIITDSLNKYLKN